MYGDWNDEVELVNLFQWMVLNELSVFLIFNKVKGLNLPGTKRFKQKKDGWILTLKDENLRNKLKVLINLYDLTTWHHTDEFYGAGLTNLIDIKAER